ncbi:MAG: transcriptional repressor [Crocinitomicaceae bacterium]
MFKCNTVSFKVVLLHGMEEMLRNKKIKVTDTRIEILRILQSSSSAISYNTIQERTSQKLDKVTVYRTLDTFESKGIIHSIPSDEGVKLYSFCKDDCEDHQHDDNHVHFNCEKCHKTICLYHTDIPKVKLPEGFFSTSSQLIVNGICRDCNELK